MAGFRLLPQQVSKNKKKKKKRKDHAFWRQIIEKPSITGLPTDTAGEHAVIVATPVRAWASLGQHTWPCLCAVMSKLQRVSQYMYHDGSAHHETCKLFCKIPGSFLWAPE